MKPIHKNITSLLILFLSAGLIFGLRSYLLDYIIRPIALLGWGVWRMMISVDQQIYWIFLIVICASLVLRLIFHKKPHSGNLQYRYAYRSLGKLDHWQVRMKDGVSNRQGQEQLRSSLRELAITLMIQGEKSDQSNPEERIAQRIDTLPQMVREYLFPPDQENGVFSRNRQKQSWYRKLRLKKRPQNDPVIDTTLQWMEAELEINHEHEQR